MQLTTKQAQILREAEDLFGRNGFRKTSMSDIAQRLGVRATALYNHFRTKDDIARSFARLLCQRQQTTMRAELARDNVPIDQRMRHVYRVLVKHNLDLMRLKPRIHEMSLSLWEDNQGGRAIMEAQREFFKAITMEMIEEGIADGTFMDGDADALAWQLILGLSAFLMPQALFGWHDRSKIYEDLESVLDVHLSFLARR